MTVTHQGWGSLWSPGPFSFLPLFTEVPRRYLLENSPAYARIPIPYWGVWCQHVCSPNRREEVFSETRFLAFSVSQFAKRRREAIPPMTRSAISLREADKECGYVGESDDGKPSRRAEEALTPTILLSRERTKILRVG